VTLDVKMSGQVAVQESKGGSATPGAVVREKRALFDHQKELYLTMPRAAAPPPAPWYAKKELYLTIKKSSI
jgi:hypothetical protein